MPPFKRHEEDCGSTEVQVARISARVTQLTSHLKEHKKDYAATRGLVKMLGQRRRLMTYLYKESRYTPYRVLRHISQMCSKPWSKELCPPLHLCYTFFRSPERSLQRLAWSADLIVHESWPFPLDVSSYSQKLDLHPAQAVSAPHHS